jgi:FMN phosphatase YigB (HAD superfamily)
MAEHKTWLIDFDDTLASGNLTWAIDYAFPKLIRENHLVHDPARLERVMLRLQEQSNQSVPLDVLLRELFETMAWPRALERAFISDLTTSYQPELFDDALPFLRRLKERGKRIIVLSNNPHSEKYVRSLGVEPYIDAIFTPYNTVETFPKPHRSLWDHVMNNILDIDPAATTVVGDDPWSDGAFASSCGLTCWIVDRGSRVREHVTAQGWRWVRTLDEISV